MKGATKFVKIVSLKAYNMNGVAAVPNCSVELVFDIAEGVIPENAVIYQVYLDGSVMKTATTVGLDGKLHANVYRLGDYAVVYQADVVVDEYSEGIDIPHTGESSEQNIALIVLITSFVVLAVLTFGKADWRENNETQYKQ